MLIVAVTLGDVPPTTTVMLTELVMSALAERLVVVAAPGNTVKDVTPVVVASSAAEASSGKVAPEPSGTMPFIVTCKVGDVPPAATGMFTNTSNPFKLRLTIFVVVPTPAEIKLKIGLLGIIIVTVSFSGFCQGIYVSGKMQ